MKHLFFFILSKILLSQNFAYEKFQEYVKSPTGCVFQIKLRQSYNNENFVSNGVFYVKGKTYIYDNIEQYIKYENQFITTINKLNKQIIYDSLKANDVTIFDILSGNQQNISFYTSLDEGKQIRTPFGVKFWGIEGSIWTDKINGSPKKIIFIQDEDLKVNIDVVSSTNDSLFNFPTFEVLDYEVINLVE